MDRSSKSQYQKNLIYLTKQNLVKLRPVCINPMGDQIDKLIALPKMISLKP